MLDGLDDESVVRIGIAEGAVVRRPTRIRTVGLGSCVGVVLYESLTGVAGLVHVMLPMPLSGQPLAPAKFATLAVPWLIQEMEQRGAALSRMRAKIAGGAQMFSFVGNSDIMRVGPRNVEAVCQSLESYGIPIVAKDVGGHVGRSIEFDGVSEQLQVRTAMQGTYII